MLEPRVPCVYVYNVEDPRSPLYTITQCVVYTINNHLVLRTKLCVCMCTCQNPRAAHTHTEKKNHAYNHLQSPPPSPINLFFFAEPLFRLFSALLKIPYQNPITPGNRTLIYKLTPLHLPLPLTKYFQIYLSPLNINPLSASIPKPLFPLGVYLPLVWSGFIQTSSLQQVQQVTTTNNNQIQI